jgi:hypothetical protein
VAEQAVAEQDDAQDPAQDSVREQVEEVRRMLANPRRTRR